MAKDMERKALEDKRAAANKMLREKVREAEEKDRAAKKALQEAAKESEADELTRGQCCTSTTTVHSALLFLTCANVVVMAALLAANEETFTLTEEAVAVISNSHTDHNKIMQRAQEKYESKLRELGGEGSSVEQKQAQTIERLKAQIEYVKLKARRHLDRLKDSQAKQEIYYRELVSKLELTTQEALQRQNQAMKAHVPRPLTEPI